MSKYKFKLKLVRENEEGYGRGFLSNKYGINESTIKYCLAKIHINVSFANSSFTY